VAPDLQVSETRASNFLSAYEILGLEPTPVPSLSLGTSRSENHNDSPATPPAPVPQNTPDFSWHTVQVEIPPRATLIKLPPPRAELVAIPLRIGNQYTLHMPYQNLEVLATFKGFLPSESRLPMDGNQLGDMFVVGPNRIPWTWILAPGASELAWIDP
jgi:hypothetical protein